MTKPQTRVVLREGDKPLVELVQAATGVGTPSEAISLLLNRYARGFSAWFESNPHQCGHPNDSHQEIPTPQVAITPAANLTPLDF